MVRRAFVLGSLLLAVACSSSAAVQAPVDIAVAPIASARAGAIAIGPEAPSASCVLRLLPAPIEKSSPGCFLDERLSKGPGTLHYPCSGTGAAEARFGDQTYAGRVDRGHLTLELATELDWEDGCRWGTRAELSGTVLRDGKPAPAKLAWKYADRILQGDDCSGTCTAHTTVAVSANMNERPKPKATDDDVDYF